MAKTKRPPAPPPGLRLEWLDPETLAPNPANWRRHPEKQTTALRAALEEVGWAGALLYNERTKRLIDGHARKEIKKGGLAPVLIGSWTEEQERLILATLDPLAAMADADAVALQALLADVATGDEALNAMLADLAAANPIIDPLPAPGGGGDEFDATPELGPTRTNVGELWAIGGVHRLLVGDCTVAENVARLMGGEKAEMAFTDPPYNVDLGSAMAPERQSTKRSAVLTNDHQDAGQWSRFTEAFAAQIKSFVTGDVYIWGAPGPEGMRMRLRLVDLGLHWSATVIWKKHHFVLSRGNYHRAYEPCFYGWFDKSSYLGDRTQSEVWEEDRPMASPEHPTMKPVALGVRAISNSSQPNSIVLDLFLGSGSTMVAAHRCGRRCHALEIEPKFADVCLRRAEAEGLAVEKAD